MKPIIILPQKAMSEADIAMLRENGLCVVVAENPAVVKFVDPIPAASQRTKIEDAAIRLSRKILNPGFWDSDSTRQNMAKCYIEILFEGTPLDARPSQQEMEKRAYDEAKLDEIRRLARVDAKQERDAAKAAKIAAAQKK